MLNSTIPSDDTIQAWRAHYGLNTRSPGEAARWWEEHNHGLAPAGAVAALGICLDRLESLSAELTALRQQRAAVRNKDCTECQGEGILTQFSDAWPGYGPGDSCPACEPEG